jgi:hypothetical protein
MLPIHVPYVAERARLFYYPRGAHSTTIGKAGDLRCTRVLCAASRIRAGVMQKARCGRRFPRPHAGDCSLRSTSPSNLWDGIEDRVQHQSDDPSF